jgi:uncharacterized RDD family membrane protein YckC
MRFCTVCGAPVVANPPPATPAAQAPSTQGDDRAWAQPASRGVEAASENVTERVAPPDATERVPPPVPPMPPFAPPMGPVPAAPPSAYASVLQRFLGILIDSLVLLGLFVLIGTLVANGTDDTTENGFNLEGGPAFLAIGLTSLVGLLYFIVMEALTGATLGKLVVGERVRMVAGGAVTPVAALIRNLLRVVDGIGGYLVGGIVALTSARKQRVGDLAAGTVVVRQAPSQGLRWGALAVAVLAAAAGIGACGLLRDPATAKQAAVSPTPTPGARVAAVASPTPGPAAPTARPGASAAPAASATPARSSPSAAPSATGTRPAGGTATAPVGALPATRSGGPITATLARDVKPNTFEPVDPTSTFPQSAPVLYVAFQAKDAGAGAKVRTVWTAVDVGQAAAPNSVIDEATVTLPRGDESGAFNLTRRDRPWPVGQYKVDFYVNDRMVLSMPFTVVPDRQ